MKWALRFTTKSPRTGPKAAKSRGAPEARQGQKEMPRAGLISMRWDRAWSRYRHKNQAGPAKSVARRPGRVRRSAGPACAAAGSRESDNVRHRSDFQPAGLSPYRARGRSPWPGRWRDCRSFGLAAPKNHRCNWGRGCRRVALHCRGIREAGALEAEAKARGSGAEAMPARCSLIHSRARGIRGLPICRHLPTKSLFCSRCICCLGTKASRLS